ncbi:hypothetical protein SEA_MAGICMAN_33 [Gordonia phage MagicMan]|uniref:Uncharacterized protein n=1 Tax=Gordonia phage Schnabeltier TaxID=1821561 RepID=A0A142KA20_9CAUD|nr:hypothetical protein BJD60_gp32 [Gordonia phage Schnabeltier]AMS02953.1 hypothetical protein SEA_SCHNABELTIER_32 [Gordonia phage Schnabeltier]QDM55850.1 hypothetical protein SEA_MAGICMAN_33 [Gordonia phage MagicMan]
MTARRVTTGPVTARVILSGMSNETPPPSGRNPENGQREDDDIVFASLVVSANSMGEEFTPYGLTVVSGGIVVSGRLISGLQYSKWLTDNDSFYQTMVDTYAAAVGEDLTDEAVLSVSYFHLADALLVSGSDTISIGHWRGAVSSVTGWTIGRIERAPREA